METIFDQLRSKAQNEHTPSPKRDEFYDDAVRSRDGPLGRRQLAVGPPGCIRRF